MNNKETLTLMAPGAPLLQAHVITENMSAGERSGVCCSLSTVCAANSGVSDQQLMGAFMHGDRNDAQIWRGECYLLQEGRGDEY